MGFGSLGWGEILLLAVVGFVVFGPDRLPRVASDAVKMLKQLRTMARGAASDLKAELGPEMADLDLRSLHPRHIVASMLDDDSDAGEAGGAAGGTAGGVEPQVPASTFTGIGGPQLAPGEPPPYDVDAT